MIYDYVLSMQMINSINWLKEVLARIGFPQPAVSEQINNYRGMFVMSIVMQEGGCATKSTATQLISMWTLKHMHSLVVALDAVRQAVTQLEIQPGHMFPDYHYFKLKALDEREPDYRMMPKRIADNSAWEMVIYYWSCASTIICFDVWSNNSHIILLFHYRTSSVIASCTRMLDLEQF